MPEEVLIQAIEQARERSIKTAIAVLDFIAAEEPTSEYAKSADFIERVAEVIRSQAPTPIGIVGIARSIDPETRIETAKGEDADG